MKGLLNWRTTGLGFLAGVLNLVASGMTWESAAMSSVFVALGVAAKDAKTGSDPRDNLR